mmetsp:Transcript_9122/g.10935  ORF Transcript_9122/g.10935 Transcript_9122/m.10935 type:complete len:174 (-) Transcript_9122:81-602(-)
MIRNNKQERNTGKSNLISGSCLSSHSTPSIEEGLDRSVKCLRTIFNSLSQMRKRIWEQILITLERRIFRAVYLYTLFRPYTNVYENYYNCFSNSLTGHITYADSALFSWASYKNREEVSNYTDRRFDTQSRALNGKEENITSIGRLWRDSSLCTSFECEWRQVRTKSLCRGLG